MAGSSILQSLVRSPATKWAVGGWSLFIVENVVLSENRSYIISQVGEDKYHYIYGTLSTIAMASTGYGYKYHVRNAPPLLWKNAMPIPFKVGGWLCLALGFGIASQTAPKLQIPVTRSSQSMNHHDDSNHHHDTKSEMKWQVRCPFDFTDSRSQSAVPVSNNGDESTTLLVSGADRISRHPGLFSFGLVSLGYGLLTPSLPMQLFFSMPMAVAIIGGAHSDSRHRRGLGGSLPKSIDDQTSLIPFYALLSGKQQTTKINETTIVDTLQDFWTHDVKKLNLALATGLATMIMLRKGRTTMNHQATMSLRKTVLG